MELHRIYVKTAKGLEEVQSRTYKLSSHLRRLLIMVDGRSTAAELISRLTALGGIESELAELEAGGFIVRPGPDPSAPDAAASAAPPTFNLNEAKQSIRSILLNAMGPAAGYRIECVEAVTTLGQLQVELDTLHDLLPKLLSRPQAEQVWHQLEPVALELERRSSSQAHDVAPPDQSASASVPSAHPEFNLDKAKGFIRFTLLGALGPSAARRIERIEATTTPEELRLELDAIRDMLPKVLSRRQAEQTWRQLEPIMISIAAPPP